MGYATQGRITMTRTVLALLIAAASWPAAAQTIYKCVDENGGTLISNTRINKECKAVVSTPETAMPAPARPRSAAANPTPADFPRVNEDAQKARDNDRKLILEQELSGEQRNLEQAKRDLSEQENLRQPPSATAGVDRLAPYRDRVAQHERNIAAIQKELGGLR
jgi:DNA polymerase III delta prime subunit